MEFLGVPDTYTGGAGCNTVGYSSASWWTEDLNSVRDGLHMYDMGAPNQPVADAGLLIQLSRLSVKFQFYLTFSTSFYFRYSMNGTNWSAWRTV